MEPKLVFLVGPPGAGKSTQCKNIEQNFGFKHVAVGNLFRDESKKLDSKFGKIISAAMKEGKLIDGKTTCVLISSDMENAKTKKFLIDGFPRNEDNLEEWIKTMGEKYDVLFVVILECPKEVCSRRCLGRAQSAVSRNDDTPECFEKRWNTYIDETIPVFSSLESVYTVHKINTEAGPEEVYLKVKKAFNDAGLNETEYSS